MENPFQPIQNNEDVISLKETRSDIENVIIQYPMFKVGDVIRKILEKILGLSGNNWENEGYQKRKLWINEGLECELLNLGSKKWKKGKVRIKVTLEFCPDDIEDIQPESPLDDIRQSINQ